MTKHQLFHTSYTTIEQPDIKYGRKNADFGQGFYLSDDISFSKRWAYDKNIYINEYELDDESLKIKYFNRDKDWFDYIYSNRNGHEDIYSEYDLIVGPVANDILYNTYGILTSGIFDNDKCFELLSIGPTYKQIVIKSNKALEQLKYKTIHIQKEDEIKKYRSIVQKEEENYQILLAKSLSFNS